MNLAVLPRVKLRQNEVTLRWIVTAMAASGEQD